MSSEPTSGDWQAQPAEGRDTDWWDIVVPHFEYPGGKTLAAYIENEADARLMASAPRLRDALRSVIEEYEVLVGAILRPEHRATHEHPRKIVEAQKVLAALDAPE